VLHALRLFPLPACATAGKRLLNAQLTAGGSQRQFPDTLMANPSSSPAFQNALRDLCGYWGQTMYAGGFHGGVYPNAGYDGWRSPWDQVSCSSPHITRRSDRSDHALTQRRSCWLRVLPVARAE
jgi:hypothetical protein